MLNYSLPETLRCPTEALNNSYTPKEIVNYINCKKGPAERRIFFKPPYSSLELSKLEKTKKRVAHLAVKLPEFWRDGDYYRFLQSKFWKTKGAAAAIADHVTWLHKINSINCPEESLNLLKNGLIYQLGRDKKYRPVIYLDFNISNVSDSLCNSFQTALEYLFILVREKMCIPYYAETFSILIDLHAKGTTSMPTDLIKKVMEAMRSNFPGCVHMVYLLNPSWTFKFGFKMLSAFIDTSRVKFLEKSEYHELKEIIDPDQLDSKFQGKLITNKQYFPPPDTFPSHQKLTLDYLAKETQIIPFFYSDSQYKKFIASQVRPASYISRENGNHSTNQGSHISHNGHYSNQTSHLSNTNHFSIQNGHLPQNTHYTNQLSHLSNNNHSNNQNHNLASNGHSGVEKTHLSHHNHNEIKNQNLKNEYYPSTISNHQTNTSYSTMHAAQLNSNIHAEKTTHSNASHPYSLVNKHSESPGDAHFAKIDHLNSSNIHAADAPLIHNNNLVNNLHLNSGSTKQQATIDIYNDLSKKDLNISSSQVHSTNYYHSKVDTNKNEANYRYSSNIHDHHGGLQTKYEDDEVTKLALQYSKDYYKIPRSTDYHSYESKNYQPNHIIGEKNHDKKIQSGDNLLTHFTNNHNFETSHIQHPMALSHANHQITQSSKVNPKNQLNKTVDNIMLQKSNELDQENEKKKKASKFNYWPADTQKPPSYLSNCMSRRGKANEQQKNHQSPSKKQEILKSPPKKQADSNFSQSKNESQDIHPLKKNDHNNIFERRPSLLFEEFMINQKASENNLQQHNGHSNQEIILEKSSSSAHQEKEHYHKSKSGFASEFKGNSPNSRTSAYYKYKAY